MSVLNFVAGLLFREAEPESLAERTFVVCRKLEGLQARASICQLVDCSEELGRRRSSVQLRRMLLAPFSPNGSSLAARPFTLRDAAIDSADRLLAGKWKSPGELKLQEQLAALLDGDCQILTLKHEARKRRANAGPRRLLR